MNALAANAIASQIFAYTLAVAPRHRPDPGPSITDWIGAIAAILTFLVALGALIYASRQVKEAREARAQARDLERERAQPYVVLIMEPSEASPVLLNIAVRNLGLTGAFNVRIRELDPWPQASGSGGRPAEPVAFPDVIPILAPGQEFVQFWDSGLTRRDGELPDRHEGVVTWEDSSGRPFESRVVLDWAVYKARHWIEVRGMHDVANAVREMQKDMRSWRESIHGSLSVFVRDGDAKDRREHEERDAYIAAGDDEHRQFLEAEEGRGDRAAGSEASEPTKPKRVPSTRRVRKPPNSTSEESK
jgi:hypothetical protein